MERLTGNDSKALAQPPHKPTQHRDDFVSEELKTVSQTKTHNLSEILTGGNDRAIITTMGINHPPRALKLEFCQGRNHAVARKKSYPCSQRVIGFKPLTI
jgi:hypothetical protein